MEKEKVLNFLIGRDMGWVIECDKGVVFKKLGMKFDFSLMIINEYKRNKMVVVVIDFGIVYFGQKCFFINFLIVKNM